MTILTRTGECADWSRFWQAYRHTLYIYTMLNNIFYQGYIRKVTVLFFDIKKMSNMRFILGLQNNRLLRSVCIYKNLPSSKCMSDWIPKEKETHTGQKWEADDYRLVRFINRPKHVNENFAVNLIAEVPPKVCKERVVWCDGGSGPTGHPKVYINLDKPGNHICGYCGLRFVLDHSH